jgi:hypothetical protein
MIARCGSRRSAPRVNGVSTPIFGVSWTPPTVDVDVARRVVAFIETRRVLFSSYTNEVPEECVQSVVAIRSFLSDVIGAGGIADELVEPLRLMRRYCVRFLERVGATEDRRDPEAPGRHLFREPRWSMHDYWFARPSASCAPASACRSPSSRLLTGWTSTTPSRRRCPRPTRLRRAACRRGIPYIHGP